jgi:putative phosphoesterase
VRVALLADIHGNLPALEAVLADVEVEGVDRIVVAGDTVTGPMPGRSLERVLALGERAVVIRGNADREAADVRRGREQPGAWPGPRDAWTIEQLEARHLDALEGLPETARLEIDGLGSVLVCHATPRSDEETFLVTTPDDVVAPMLAGADADVVVCGHTHMQFDRVVGGVRILNPGSVGMPHEAEPGAYWALIGPGVELRRTAYDPGAAGEAIRATGRPSADEFVRENVEVVPTREEALAAFEPLVGQRT